jgi:integrase/recombinase XerD
VTLTSTAVNTWVADLLDAGAEAATARSRQLAVRRFSAWLAAEGEIPADQLARMSPPKLDAKAIHPLTDEQLVALLAACKGPDLRDKRDEALIRLAVETGARAGEILALRVTDVDLAAGAAVITKGKGGKARRVPFGPRTGAAIDRYIRARRHHRLASTSILWLGQGGKEFSYHALRGTLRYRAERAGIGALNPHLLRHTAAHRWLAAGGSEGGLMAVAGWTRPDMLLRYTKARAEQRAADEARRLNLGDL